MPSAVLPPELQQIARDAARNGRRPAPPRTATIKGLGHYLPTEIVPNGHIAERIGVDDHWIVKRTGIQSRRRAAANEGTNDMAVFAARRALQDSGTDARDLDFVIVATMSPDEITPNAAPRVAHALGADRAAAFDIGAACTGFLAGLAQAAALIEVGRAERILLIGAEKLTRITDFDDKKTGMLFGDGAGAVVLGPSDSDAGIGPIDLLADGGLGDTIVATNEDPYIRMDGISTFKIAIKRLSESTIFAVSAAGYEPRGHRPVRLSPGQLADPQGRRRAPRARPGQGRGLHRAARQHERRVDPADACRSRVRTAACVPGTRCSWPRSAPASPGAPA